jgi:hypothetical protein
LCVCFFAQFDHVRFKNDVREFKLANVMSTIAKETLGVQGGMKNLIAGNYTSNSQGEY